MSASWSYESAVTRRARPGVISRPGGGGKCGGGGDGVLMVSFFVGTYERILREVHAHHTAQITP